MSHGFTSPGFLSSIDMEHVFFLEDMIFKCVCMCLLFPSLSLSLKILCIHSSFARSLHSPLDGSRWYVGCVNLDDNVFGYLT